MPQFPQDFLLCSKQEQEKHEHMCIKEIKLSSYANEKLIAKVNVFYPFNHIFENFVPSVIDS